MTRDSLLQIILDLERWVSENDYSGYDPYDGLRSRILRFVPLPGKYPKIAWIQFFKRCPVNLRPLFLIPPGRNPKGMGLFLSSYVYLYRATGDRIWLEKAFEVAEWLDENAVPNYSGKCWGYNFDWQSRAFFVPRGTPTIVNTSFIGHAFLDLFEASGDSRWLDISASACEFILNDLNRFESPDHICFSYTPVDSTRVHNANLLGCGLLARVSATQSHSCWDTEIQYSMSYTVDHQRNDGAWFYAETDYQRWIDSFHTGFNLFSLRWIQDYTSCSKIQNAVYKGETFYAQNFFLSDGTPKYYHDRVYPIDIHSPAMALRYFGALEARTALSNKVSNWLVANMRQERGTFSFQQNEISLWGHSHIYVNPIPYMRWSQAWAMFGLSWLLLSEGPQNMGSKRAAAFIDSQQYATTLH
ncbi:delta-aminolevulinic acid dehydratase [bacterium]|nr:delta-aminolevulinic acid dehydratase [bacterium]